MSRINRFLIILFLLCNVAENYGQDSEDHLEPVGSIYDIYDFQFAYYSKVRKVLFEGLTNFPEIRFQVMPSFTPENVLDIEYDTENGKYYLVYHICEKMIWYNEKWDEIKVDKYRSAYLVKETDVMILAHHGADNGFTTSNFLKMSAMRERMLSSSISPYIISLEISLYIAYFLHSIS